MQAMKMHLRTDEEQAEHIKYLRRAAINELGKKFAIAFIHQGGNPDEANVKGHKLAEEYFELYEG